MNTKTLNIVIIFAALAVVGIIAYFIFKKKKDSDVAIAQAEADKALAGKSNNVVKDGNLIKIFNPAGELLSVEGKTAEQLKTDKDARIDIYKAAGIPIFGK
ncbi:MAG TPA: hypothetical protein VL098_12615 [Flavipsychrobacter sp.]|nr:hypothetical protein [Flavipsychrobacter sp.]